MADRDPQILWQGDIDRPTGLAWLRDANCLLVCDPDGERVASLDPASAAVSFLEMDGAISFCFPTRDGELLMGDGSDLVRLDSDGEAEVEIRVDMPVYLQTGLGTVDRSGTLWFAAPDRRDEGADGRVYRYHDGRMIPSLFDRCRPGGVAVSADGQLLFHANGAKRRIETYRVNSASALSPGEVLPDFPEAWGEPRGLALDQAGDLWVALSKGLVARVSADGAIAEQVRIADDVIDVAFGGGDLATLYVSTPGKLFAFKPDKSGMPMAPVKLSAGETLGLIEDDDH